MTINTARPLPPKHVSILFAGAGLAGLSLALELAQRPAFANKKILLLDRDRKQQNDRTWCFWATDAESLPPVVFRTWDRCRFFAPGFETEMDIAPYRYRMVRGADYYAWAHAELQRHTNVELLRATITEMDTEKGLVCTDAGDFTGDVVFNSAFTPVQVVPVGQAAYPKSPFSVPISGEQNARANTILLLQHFKGWLIETPAPTFDPAVMTFMDFRIEQHGETRFVYVLPFSENRALVEFTVFSPALLAPETYNHELHRYMNDYLGISDFRIEEQEFGVIPMTDYPFPATQKGKTIHIGTAGGFVKPSSGYAFKRTQRKARAFAGAWERTGKPDAGMLQSPWIFRQFDGIFLRVLQEQNELGTRIFSDLFRKLPPALVLRFLDEDSSACENLRLVSAPPARPFLKAFFKKIAQPCAALFSKNGDTNT
ncbi:MAG: lycopene cyclase family protein [Saprospiraceae bacterium]